MTEPIEWQRADALTARVGASVRPLFRERGRRFPELIGNSVLIRVGDRCFALTAAHVLAEVDASTRIMSIPTFAPMTGEYHCNRGPGRVDREDDHLDAGVFSFRARSEPSDLPGRCLQASDLNANCISVGGRAYLMIGFPASRSEKTDGNDLTPDMGVYIAEEAAFDVYRRWKLNPLENLILHFDRSRARRPDGAIVTAPGFRGTSGSGIWRFASRGGAERTADDKLVAIMTGFAKGLIFATRVPLHIALISAYHPALESLVPRSNFWPIRVEAAASPRDAPTR